MSNTHKDYWFNNSGVFHFASELRAAQREKGSDRRATQLIHKLNMVEMGEQADYAFIDTDLDGGIVIQTGLGLTRQEAAELLREAADAIEKLSEAEAMDEDAHKI